MAEADVTGDGSEPRRVAGRVAEAVGVTPRLEHGLLCQVLGGLGIAGKVGAEADEAGALGAKRVVKIEGWERGGVIHN